MGNNCACKSYDKEQNSEVNYTSNPFNFYNLSEYELSQQGRLIIRNHKDSIFVIKLYFRIINENV